MEKEQYRFSLEFHLLEWRRGFSKTSLTKDDIDELTQHLRDHFNELIKDGNLEGQAWQIAIKTMGSHKTIVKEFDKVWYIFLKNTSVYYIVAIVAPGLLLGLLLRSDSNNFVFALGICVIYRIFVDFLRLRSRNVINKNGIWKLLIPGARIRYFRDLYF